MDGFLEGDWGWEQVEVGSGHAGVFGDGFYQHRADGQVFYEVGVDPAVAACVCLLELDGAAGGDAGDDAEAEVYGLEDVTVDAG